jgi:hypothetical protein
MWNCYADGSASTGSSGGPGTDGAGMLISSPRDWATASTMGMLDSSGNQNVYLEDCTFKNVGQWPDIDNDGRAVFRYCRIDGTWGVTHGFTSGGGGFNSGRQFEFYNNRFETTSSVGRNMANRYFWCRGGTGIFTDNTAVQAVNTSAYAQGSVDQLDLGDNTAPGTYPSAGVPGWGHNGSTIVLDPIYMWNQSGNEAYSYHFEGSWGSQVQLNRELYVNNGAKPGYVKYVYPHPLRSGGGADLTPPTIQNTNVTSITSSGFIVGWTTTENSTNALDYGTSLSYGTTLTQSEAASFSQAVSGLSSSTLYYLRIRSGDAAGNKSTNTLSSTTVAVDSTPPSFNAGSTNIINISYSGATIVGTTTESAKSGVTWGYTTATTTGIATNGANFSTTPSVAFSGVTAATLVYMRFWVSDAAGNTNSVLASFTTAAAPAPGDRIFYIDQSAGNDNNPGTSISPWKNCPGMQGTSEYTGNGSLLPGDVIYFDRGDTWLVSSGGESQSSFTLSPGVKYVGDVWGAGTRAKIWLNARTESGIIRFRLDHESIPTWLQGFDTSGQDIYTGTGIDINHGFWSVGNTRAQKVVTNNYIHNLYANSGSGDYCYGIIVSDNSGDASGWVANVTIENNIVTSAPRDFITLYPGDSGMISNCVVRGNYVSGSATDPGYSEGHGIVAKGNVKDSLIEFNTVSNMTSSAVFINGPESGSGNGPTNLIVRHNILQTFDNNGTLRFYGTGIQEADIYGNIFLTNSSTGAINADGVSGTVLANIYNNTFVQTWVDIGNPTTATINFSNNIIWATGLTPLDDSSTKITSHSNNVFYRTGAGTALAVRGGTTYTSGDLTTYEASALSSDPLFVNTATLPIGFVGSVPSPAGLDLQSGSPALNTAGTVSGGDGLSINGLSRPQGSAWDRGAYESPVTADTTPPTLVAVRVGGDGLTWRFQYSEPSGFGSGGTGGHTVSMSGGACTLTYLTGAGSSVYYTGSRVIQITETGTAAYVQPTDGVQDAAGNDVVSWSGSAVINESSQGVNTSIVVRPPSGVRVVPGI